MISKKFCFFVCKTSQEYKHSNNINVQWVIRVEQQLNKY